MANQYLNQFKITGAVGELDMQCNPNPNVMTCRYVDANASETELTPGYPVKLVDLGTDDFAGPPVVDIVSGDNDGGAFGVKLFSTKSNEAESGEIVQIACENSVVVMQATAAIERGASVAAEFAVSGGIVTRTTEDQLGIALDKAEASGDLIRMLVKPVAVEAEA